MSSIKKIKKEKEKTRLHYPHFAHTLLNSHFLCLAQSPFRRKTTLSTDRKHFIHNFAQLV